MNRTIAEAREALDTAAGLSDEEKRNRLSEIAEAEGAASAHAQNSINQANLRFHEKRIAHEEALRKIEQRHRELIAAAESGDLSAKDFGDEFAKLRRARHAHLEVGAALYRDLERIAVMVDDPIGYIDELYKKFPALNRPSFTF